MAVVLHHNAGFAQGPEQFPVEALITEAAMKALNKGPVEKVGLDGQGQFEFGVLGLRRPDQDQGRHVVTKQSRDAGQPEVK